MGDGLLSFLNNCGQPVISVMRHFVFSHMSVKLQLFIAPDL